MSPHEILMPGGGNEHFNDEPGKVWLEEQLTNGQVILWINPIPIDRRIYSPHSISLIKKFFRKNVPLTIKGRKGNKVLSKRIRVYYKVQLILNSLPVTIIISAESRCHYFF